MKRLLIILFLIMFIVSIIRINIVYAKYKEELSGSYEHDIARWNVSVNNKKISFGENAIIEIDENHFMYDPEELNPHISTGKIAPSRVGYFIINIDPRNSDVSIVYTLDIWFNKVYEKTDHKLNFKIIRVENNFKKMGEENIPNGTQEIKDDNENLYRINGIMKYDLIKDGWTNEIKIYFTWQNDESLNLGDQKIGGVVGNTMNLPVEVEIKQYVGI